MRCVAWGLLLAASLFLTGCNGGMTSQRWVDGREFHSSSFPAMTVKVPKGYKYVDAGQEEGYVEEKGSGYGVQAYAKSNSFIFVNALAKSEIFIETEHLGDDLVYRVPSFARIPDILEHGTEDINGDRYYYGMWVGGKASQPLLIRQLTRMAGDQDIIKVLYIEGVDQSFNDLNLALMTSEQKAFIQGFKKRAAEAIVILPYQGQPPPDMVGGER